MLIIAGKVYVDPEKRDAYAEAHQALIRQARATPGCPDLVIAADPIEPGRMNNIEAWESEKHLAAWRAIAQPPAETTPILRDEDLKYQISSSGPPF